MCLFLSPLGFSLVVLPDSLSFVFKRGDSLFVVGGNPARLAVVFVPQGLDFVPSCLDLLGEVVFCFSKFFVE